ncbi:MAG: TetR family transcriptional regulator C-terminal domain-containing protein [Paracoccaceae bacterium]|nr:MAG: TetR family transcriptional regulator C-terminal domain-containing protein [Paracoccaceae bacterium]
MTEGKPVRPGATGDRKPFRREGEEKRREALIAAAVELVAEGGTQAATVRAVAERAGVTPGLIRHYFQSRGELLRAAYARVMGAMTLVNHAAVIGQTGDPLVQLAVFVAASLRPPVVDPTTVGLWAGFIHMVQRDQGIRDTHMATYLDYRDRLQALIAALPREVPAARLRADAIACNAVIDGLWLEASVLPEAFAPGEIERIGLTSVGAILGVDLAGAMP